jgi:hypothetical protein
MAETWRQALGSQRLLVSGFGKWGGGVYDLTSGAPVAFDDLPSSGLALGEGRLWRLLRAPGEQTATCELLSYDHRGVRSYERYDTIRDPHDVCWHNGAIHISSSWDSIVWRIEPGRAPEPVWQGGEVPDSWHVNSLLVVDGRLHVCVFGRFDTYKGWKGEEKDTGFVHDTERGVDVLTGLAHPHDPRWLGDRWYVCESTKGSLAEIGPRGRVARRAPVRRFSRGLAIVGDWALVGGNAHRKDEDDRAEVVVVDRRSFEVVERIGMPCLEVYDILPVPFALARGVALGFGANPARSVEQHRGRGRVIERRPTTPEARVELVSPRVAAKLASAGQPLDRKSAAGLRLSADLPEQMHPGEALTVPVTIENRSRVSVATVVPNPIRLAARWVPLDHELGEDEAPPRNPFAPLPELLHSGDRGRAEVLLVAPDRPGRYQVRVVLHQPNLGWFGRRAQGEILVVAEGAVPLAPSVASPTT